MEFENMKGEENVPCNGSGVSSKSSKSKLNDDNWKHILDPSKIYARSKQRQSKNLPELTIDEVEMPFSSLQFDNQGDEQNNHIEESSNYDSDSPPDSEQKPSGKPPIIVKVEPPQTVSPLVYSAQNRLPVRPHFIKLTPRSVQAQIPFRNTSNFEEKSSANSVQKNETKNIPKNFGKAIIVFAIKNPDLIDKILAKMNISLTKQECINFLETRKKSTTSIPKLKSLWLSGDSEHAKLFRVISEHFIRRSSLNYVFGSRISNRKSHIKYRHQIMKAVRHPADFTCIKQGGL